MQFLADSMQFFLRLCQALSIRFFNSSPLIDRYDLKITAIFGNGCKFSTIYFLRQEIVPLKLKKNIENRLNVKFSRTRSNSFLSPERSRILSPENPEFE